ncbi:RrF2 family transcriptional regulator [Guggenheimella bovis]
MNLSTRGRYGLRALCELAKSHGSGPMSLASIAKEQNISVRYLEQLFQKLKKAGIVDSVRGVNGGYLLARDPKSITVAQIVEPLDGDVSPIPCTPGCTDCADPSSCPTKPLWSKLHEKVYEVMDQTTLFDLIERE